MPERLTCVECRRERGWYGPCQTCGCDNFTVHEARLRLRPWGFLWRVKTCGTAYRYDGLGAAWRWIVHSEDPSAEYEQEDDE